MLILSMHNTQLLEYNCYIFDLVLSISRYNVFTSSLKQLLEFLIFFPFLKEKKKRYLLLLFSHYSKRKK